MKNFKNLIIIILIFVLILFTVDKLQPTKELPIQETELQEKVETSKSEIVNTDNNVDIEELQQKSCLITSSVDFQIYWDDECKRLRKEENCSLNSNFVKHLQDQKDLQYNNCIVSRIMDEEWKNIDLLNWTINNYEDIAREKAGY